MPDPLALHLSDGASRVVIADTTGTPLMAPLVEISPAHAIIASDAEFEPNAYLDLTLELKGQPPRKFFAHVVATEAAGVRIRWMHLDPGEEQKLKGLLAAYARSLGSSGNAAAPPGHGTRRVIRPKTETIVPFGAGGSAAEVKMPAPPPEKDRGGDEHRATRRVIKPSARLSSQSEEHEPSAAAPGEESKGHPVVLAPTDKFEKLRQIEDVDRPKEASGAQAALSATPPETTPSGGNPAQPAATGDALADLPGESPSGRHTAVIGKDGRMDVGAAIRQKAKTVRASDLAARHDKVRVLNMGTIKALIQDAVEEAASHLTRALGEAERKRLLEEAEEGFKERLKAFELDKKSAEEKARVLQNDLSAAKELLEQERKRSIQADQFTVSEAGLVEIDERMAKIIERAVSRGEAGPDLELKLRELIAHILDSEREKMREKELAAHNDKIALLEKKVARLANSLDETEKERDEARQIADAMEKHGISAAEVKNKYKIGIDASDANRERKLALMKELVEQNRELRKQLGLKTVDPAQVAKEMAEEVEKAKAAREKAKAEALADRAALKAEQAGGAPAAAAVAPEPEPAPAAEEPAAEPASAEPAVNPDDEVWTPAPPKAAAAAEDDRGVKILRDYKKFEPPPLEAAPSPEDAAQVEIDPDDQPWSPSAESAPAAEDASPSGVKRIAVAKKEPPPLAR